jgi:1-acyl-sn-glycerol-3-phosphate acyltransferase
MAWLNYGWRWFGTASSFAVFGIGGLILGATVLPLIALCIRNRERKLHAIRRVIGGSMRCFVIYMHRVGVLHYRVDGLENVDPRENYLILANHPSLIDVVFLLAYFPTADCVIKSALLKSFFVQALLRAADYIPNTDPTEFIISTVERLQNGHSVILFPEGTRTTPGESLDFKAGAAAIATRSGCQCLPVFIHCQPTTLTKSNRWYHVPERRVFLSLAVQKPLAPEAVVEKGINARLAARQFNEYLENYFTNGLRKNSPAEDSAWP